MSSNMKEWLAWVKCIYLGGTGEVALVFRPVDLFGMVFPGFLK